jgi:hypothetical protein
MQESGSLVAELHALRENLERESQLRKEEQRRREDEERLHEEEKRRRKESEAQLEKVTSKLSARESTATALYLYLAGDAGIDAEAVQMYSDTAERMRNHEETKTYIDSLYTGFIRGKKSRVFNALCVPSGSGKTQLAFALPKEKCTCIYLNMACDEESIWKRQQVYRPFVGYMNFFLFLLKEDYATGNRISVVLVSDAKKITLRSQF